MCSLEYKNEPYASISDKHSNGQILLGIDTGGTFTDFVCIDQDGNLKRWKVLSTPSDPSKAIIKGLCQLLKDYDPEKIEIVHGTTVGTNAFLERKGARICLITNRGFEDVIFIGRQARPSLYNFMVKKPRPIIEPEFIFGLDERCNAQGVILKTPSPEELINAMEFCTKKGAESIAVCLLHSYANPENEEKVGSFLRKYGLKSYLSSKILPEFREFERLSTTLINAYLGPVVGHYIHSLEKKLPTGSILFIQQSDGGCTPSKGIDQRAVTTLLSGPAGGVLGALQLGKSLGFENIITFDMGGTSTDVSLLAGALTFTKEYRIEGFPIAIPMIDIHTVGAGGGSIAWIDKGGLLKVGPQSAGADPGPICYGKGEALTVTDANLFLGRLIPENFLAGRMPLDKDKVIVSMKMLAKRLNLQPDDAALGIIKLVNTNMVQAIRAVSIEKGFDPRQFILTSFGGAAGLHALELAEELEISKVLIPKMAGVFSAQGMAGSDLSFKSSLSIFFENKDGIFERLERAFDKIYEKISNELPFHDKNFSSLETEKYLDVRYKGQSFEITVPFSKEWERAFQIKHKRLYGYFIEKAPIEITAIRLRVKLLRNKSPMLFPYLHDEPVEPIPFSTSNAQMTEVIFKHGKYSIPVIYKEDMEENMELRGPALLIDDFTTILILEGWRCINRGGHILAEIL